MSDERTLTIYIAIMISVAIGVLLFAIFQPGIPHVS